MKIPLELWSRRKKFVQESEDKSKDSLFDMQGFYQERDVNLEASQSSEECTDVKKVLFTEEPSLHTIATGTTARNNPCRQILSLILRRIQNNVSSQVLEAWRKKMKTVNASRYHQEDI